MPLDPRALGAGSIQQLDGPPPSPAMPGLAQLSSGPGLAASSAAIPPEIVEGLIQTSTSMANMLTTYAEMLPPFAGDFQRVTEALQVAVANVLAAGGAPGASTDPGTSFPGSGPNRSPLPSAR